MRRFRGGILMNGDIMGCHTECGRGKLPYFFNRSNCLVSVSTLSMNRFVHSDCLRSLRSELPPLRLSEAGKCRRGDIAACRCSL